MIINLKKISKKIKTPIFIYNKKKILNNIKKYKKNNIKIFFAIKSNYNNYIIKLLNKKNIGFETVSIGEILKLKKLKIKSSKIIYSGICKKYNDLKKVIKMKIKYINVEHIFELKKIIKICKKKKIIQKIFLKINFNIKAYTNKKISTNLDKNKFGMYKKEILNCIKIINKYNFIILKGISIHLGSQIKKFLPFKIAIKKMKKLYKIIKNKFKIKLILINLGGGIGIDYTNNISYIKKILKKIKKIIKVKFIMEPGRSILGNSCITLTKVIYIRKRKKINIAIVDIGMDSIIRPALYKSFHKIIFFKKCKNNFIYQIMGPVCESTDIIGKDVIIKKLKINDLIIINSTGAYCLSMRSNYNIIRKPNEIIISKKYIKKI